MAITWKELTEADLTDLDTCADYFNYVATKGGHTKYTLAQRLSELFAADPATNGVADPKETRMFRVFLGTNTDPGNLSIALDRTIRRVVGVATRDHWCITIGLSDQWPVAASAEFARSAASIYQAVKSQLKIVQTAGIGTFKLALIWQVRDPADDRTKLDATVLVDGVMNLLLNDRTVPLTPNPRDGATIPMERAYAHFGVFLDRLYPNAPDDNYLRFVEVGVIP